MNNHPYHLVNNSPWPLLMSFSLMVLAFGLLMLFHGYFFDLMIFGILCLFIVAFQWWRDVTRESTYQGIHTKSVVMGIKFGMIMFILSEVFFFVSFFWSFFHMSLSPSIEIGLEWPPAGIFSFNPMNIPMLNTVVLLCSGFSLTWSHHSLILSDYYSVINGLLVTIFLGLYFSVLQLYEYVESSFCISDSVYGSLFFMTTGFHGIHVIIGTVFIFVCFFRMKMLHFSSYHHVGFELAAWYWHFVDVVWLFLYISFYWWGS